jgi:hypothetical protein
MKMGANEASGQGRQSQEKSAVKLIVFKNMGNRSSKYEAQK